jgi:hypothetical protein
MIERAIELKKDNNVPVHYLVGLAMTHLNVSQAQLPVVV